MNLFSQSQIVPVAFSAYYENDGITEQQESVYSLFLEEKDKQLEKLQAFVDKLNLVLKSKTEI